MRNKNFVSNLKAIFFLAAIVYIDSLSAQDIKFVTSNYISLTVPQKYQGEIEYMDSNNLLSNKKLTEIKHDKSLLNSFPNIVSSVTVFQVQNDGSLKFTGNTVSAKNETYVVIYDFSQTQTLELIISNKSSFVSIGVGVRMVARVTTKERNINLTTPIGLGIAASRKKVTGSLEVRASGIGSPKINSVIPVTSDLSPASIENALQSVATIKSHIYDDDAKITPEFLAFNTTNSTATISFDEIQKTISSLISSLANPTRKAASQQQPKE